MKSKFWFLLVIIFLVSFFGYSGNRLNTVEKIGGDLYGEVIVSNGMGKAEYTLIYTNYGFLEPDEAEIYVKICEKVENGEKSFEFRNADKDKVINAFSAVLNDHPEYFWLGHTYSYKTTEYIYGTYVTLEPVVSEAFGYLTNRKTQLDNAVNEVLSLCNGTDNMYEKMIIVHDYIVDNTDYDYEAAKTITSLEETNDAVIDASSAYGCLVNHKAVCSGYSAAFQLIMQKIGIPCGRVAGYKTEGENHEWNYVFFDNDYYYIDVTWDDPQSSEAFRNVKSYEFFCITTDELEKTHIIDEEGFVPLCSAIKYDYYIYHNKYFNTYDFYSFEECVKNSEENSITVKFSSEEELQKAVYDLFEVQKIFSILNQDHVSYSTGVSGLVLSIPFDS